MVQEKIRKNNKKSLADFYNSLPEVSAPKQAFVEKVAEKCNVTQNTVRNWIKGRAKPTSKEHLEILSKETGIPEKKLFQSEE